MKLPPDVNLLAAHHYLQALHYQRRITMVVGILGAKTPQVQTLTVGGVTNPINPNSPDTLNMERLYLVKTLLEEADPSSSRRRSCEDRGHAFGADRGAERAPRGPAITRVERTVSFQRLLEKHRSSPGRPAEAARKAERILAAPAAGERLCPWEAGSLTRWGAARLPGCVKYELCGGYRLICRRRGATLLALFLGNHEECHSWLRVSRGFEDMVGEVAALPAQNREPEERVDKQPLAPSQPPAAREYSDGELRAVFAELREG